MQRIHSLSPFVANQIAAGEVIERPASVVKELLENAVDAGADIITLELSFGGLNQIKISDNGSGILAADLPLALAPHATSKIQQLSDLYQLHSMGFRGEALASIASIARVNLTAKPATQEYAMRLTSDEYGVKIMPCARAQGTTVDVLDLFYNTPVRKKFLKSEMIEYSAIEDVVKRFALSAPQIAITVWHNSTQQFFLPAAHCDRTRLLRVHKIFGKSFVEHAIFIDVTQDDLNLTGWISSSKYQRSQNNRQWIYLNRRMIKDKLIDNAVRQAYTDLLHPGRYPACVLYLSLPADVVDVNVHPNKHEVRFQDPRTVHDLIRHQILHALLDQNSHDEQNNVSQTASEITGVNKLVAATGANQSAWFALNAQFAVISLTESRQYNVPYLVDASRVLQEQYTILLAESGLPLMARPLLVPITYQLSSVTYQRSDLWMELFKHFGIQIELIGADKIAVRTLPVSLPLLDLSQIFSGLENNDEWDLNSLSKLFVGCIQCDILQWDADQRSIFTDYLSGMLNSVGFSGCVRLDVDRCRVLYAE